MQYAAILWVLSAILIIRAAWRSQHHPDALRLGRIAFAFLYLVAGAGMNAVFLATRQSYAKFADGTYLPFVRHAWHSVVVPHPGLWIGLLIAFEAIVGLLALSGGTRLQLAYGLAIAFHVGLLAFGCGFYLWALPMITAYSTLLRNERRRAHPSPSRDVVDAANPVKKSGRGDPVPVGLGPNTPGWDLVARQSSEVHQRPVGGAGGGRLVADLEPALPHPGERAPVAHAPRPRRVVLGSADAHRARGSFRRRSTGRSRSGREDSATPARLSRHRQPAGMIRVRRDIAVRVAV